MPLSKITNPFLDPAGAARSNVYSPSANTIGIVTSGIDRVRVDSSGNMGVGTISPLATIHSTKAGAEVARFTNSNSNGGDWEFKIGGGGFEDRKLMITDKFSGADNVRVSIDSTGRVTKPFQPTFWAVKISTVTTDGVITSYDTVYHNVGNCFNNSTGTFTCPVAGKYLAIVSSLLSSGTYHIDDMVQKNGSTLSGYWLRSSINGSGEYETNGATMIFDCAANDTLRYNIASKTGNLYSDGNGWIRFGVYFLG